MGIKKRQEVFLKFIIYLIVVVLINMAGTTLFYRLDLTKNRIFSLSKASKEAVSTLSEPLTINVFFTKDLPAPHNNTERYLRDLLEEYSFNSNKYFNFRFYDMSEDEGNITQKAAENRELASSYGIYPVQIQAVEKDEVKFQRAYMGMVLIHGDIMERIPTVTSTDRLEYRITTAIRKLNNKVSALLAMEGKISIKLILSSSLEQVGQYMDLKDLDKLPDQVKKTVEKLNGKNFDRFDFKYIDPEKDGILDAELEKQDIIILSWPAIEKYNIDHGRGSIGLIMEYMGKTRSTPILQIFNLPIIGTQYQLVEMDMLEENITENMETLIGINEDLGYLASHGTLNLSGANISDPARLTDQASAQNFNTIISEIYSIKEVNLEEESIPEGIDCLLIARPTEKFTDYDLFQIDQFLMRGKNIALFMDAFNEMQLPASSGMQQPPVYVPLDTGLEKLLGHYGIELKKSMLMDENCYKQQGAASYGLGEIPLYFAPIIKNSNINKELPFINNLKALVVAKISPLELDLDRIKENNLKAHRLFSSSDKSWEMTGMINLNPMSIHPPASEDEKSSFPLAYILEGEFPSYFAGQDIPEKESKDNDSEEAGKDQEKEESGNTAIDINLSAIKEQGTIISKGKPARFLLIGSSELLKDNMLDPEEPTTNSTFIVNVLDYLNNNEDIAVMRSKEHALNPLYDISTGLKTVIKSLNIVGLPIVVILFGLFIFFRRQFRKKSIHAMFQ